MTEDKNNSFDEEENIPLNYEDFAFTSHKEGEEFDDRIGLTRAFSPSVDERVGYDEGDDPIGLTKAFGPVSYGDCPEDDGWNNAWSDDREFDTYDDLLEPNEPAIDSTDEEIDESLLTQDGEQTQEEETEEDFQAVFAAKVAARKATRAQKSDDIECSHGVNRETGNEEDALETEPFENEGVAVSDSVIKKEKKKKKPMSRMRKVLIFLIIALLIVAAGLMYTGYRALDTGQNVAQNESQNQAAENDKASIAESTGKDASTHAEKTVKVPNLSALLGLTEDEAIETVGCGAVVTAERDIDDEDNPIVSTATLTLVDEPFINKADKPTVYLGFNADGLVIQAGYSTSVGSLGHGSLSFADAVDKEDILRKAFDEAGISVEEGSFVLPEDPKEYSTINDKGETTRERCSFSGPVEVNGISCTWSAVLTYDYSSANLSGDLARTVRTLYIYVTEDVS